MMKRASKVSDCAEALHTFDGSPQPMYVLSYLSHLEQGRYLKLTRCYYLDRSFMILIPLTVPLAPFSAAV